MLTLELLQQFSNECLRIRRALYSGLPFNEKDALFVRSHVQLLLSDIERFTSPDDPALPDPLPRRDDPGAQTTLQ